MGYVNLKTDLPPKEDTWKANESMRKTNLFFLEQSSWTYPYAKTYVNKLFKEAPQAKTAVKGKLAIVTGVTIGGIGYYMSEELAVNAEMHVIVMGRNEKKLKASVEAIKKSAKKRGVDATLYVVAGYDLDDLQSAVSSAEAAMKIANDKYNGEIQILINNAGANNLHYGTTKQGIEINVGRNYVCPHLLTTQLLPALKKAARPGQKPRVSFLSSGGHIFGQINPATLLSEPAKGGAPDGFIDLKGDKPYKDPLYGPSTMYGCAKFGLIAAAVQWTKEYPEINFTAINPGAVVSNFHDNLGIAGLIFYYGFYFFNYVASQGAVSTLRPCLDPDFNGLKALQGAYIASDANPRHPDQIKVEDPKTKELYTLDDYSADLMDATTKLIEKSLK